MRCQRRSRGISKYQVPMYPPAARTLLYHAVLAALIVCQAAAYEDSVNSENGPGGSELGLAVQGALGNKVLIPATPATFTSGATANGLGSQPDSLEAPSGGQTTVNQPDFPSGHTVDTSAEQSSDSVLDPEDRAKRVNLEIFRKDSDVKADPLQRGTRWWSKRPLIQMTKEQVKEMDEKYPYITADESAYGALVPASVAHVQEFINMNDTELYTYFKYGTADIPSNQPGEAGMWTYCYGQPLINAFTQSGWPNGIFPEGMQNPFNNFADRVWRGKVFYTPPGSSTTQLWNLLYSNSTVGIVGNVTLTEGITDKQPSAVADYGHTEAFWLRPLRDELRKVGPNVWLGRGWITNLAEGWAPTDPLPPFDTVVHSALTPLANATMKATLLLTGLEGPNSSPTSSGGYYADPGQPFAFTYFAMECINNAVPKLFYTSGAELLSFADTLTGYNPVFYKLPDLNPSAGSYSVENWSLEFPRSVDPNYPPFILWPWKISDMGPIGYMKLPAVPFEVINGAFWLYNNGNPLQLAAQANVGTGQGTVQAAPSAREGVLTSVAQLPDLPSMFNNPGPVVYNTPTLGTSGVPAVATAGNASVEVTVPSQDAAGGSTVGASTSLTASVGTTP
eukprot:jgi/Botrbrau1/13073/Bobra.0187s0035.1